MSDPDTHTLELSTHAVRGICISVASLLMNDEYMDAVDHVDGFMAMGDVVMELCDQLGADLTAEDGIPDQFRTEIYGLVAAMRQREEDYKEEIAAVIEKEEANA